MNYYCHFCNRTLSLGFGSYLYYRSLIMLHVAACENAWDLAPDERVREISRAAHALMDTGSLRSPTEGRRSH